MDIESLKLMKSHISVKKLILCLLNVLDVVGNQWEKTVT